MINHHQLGISVIDNTNENVLCVYDTSFYSEYLEVTCAKLQVLSPGFQEAVEIPVRRMFHLVLSACQLGTQFTDCYETMNPLSDGVYALKYSVSPNEEVFVEINHLRMVEAERQYARLLCGLDLSGCATDVEKKEAKSKLEDIRMYLDSAKVQVEECHNPKKGMALYNFAVKLMEKTECKTC